MAVIPLGTDDIESKDETAARIRLENMYLIDSPFSPDGVSRVSRPTLTQVMTVGTGPIMGTFRKDGVFDGNWFVVSNDTLYSINSLSLVATPLGIMPGSGYCEFAGGSISTGPRLLILRDGAVYSWDGTTFTQVVVPDGVSIGSIDYLENFYFLSVSGTPTERGRFYWISPGLTDPDPLDFATAERQPDDLESVAVVGDELWMLGSQSGEVWISSGNADSPFQAVQARAYNYGCLSRDTVAVTTLGGTPAMFWVTDSRTVAMAQASASPQKVSNDSVDEILRDASDFRAWAFRYNRHSFYILTCSTATLVYDVEKQNWARWSSYMLDYWRAHLGFQQNEQVYAGDSESNNLYKLEEGVSDNGDPIIRTVAGLVIFAGNYENCFRVNVIMNSGWTKDYGPSSILELRWSDDLGNTFGPWLSAPVGETGAYQTDVSFSGLGMIRRPGRLFQFRYSDMSRFRLDYATMNEM